MPSGCCTWVSTAKWEMCTHRDGNGHISSSQPPSRLQKGRNNFKLVSSRLWSDKQPQGAVESRGRKRLLDFHHVLPSAEATQGPLQRILY